MEKYKTKNKNTDKILLRKETLKDLQKNVTIEPLI